MIFHAIRIQHIDLKVLFNFARDHERIKANDYFKKRLCLIFFFFNFFIN